MIRPHVPELGLEPRRQPFQPPRLRAEQRLGRAAGLRVGVLRGEERLPPAGHRGVFQFLTGEFHG